MGSKMNNTIDNIAWIIITLGILVGYLDLLEPAKQKSIARYLTFATIDILLNIWAMTWAGVALFHQAWNVNHILLQSTFWPIVTIVLIIKLTPAILKYWGRPDLCIMTKCDYGQVLVGSPDSIWAARKNMNGLQKLKASLIALGFNPAQSQPYKEC